MGINTTGDWVVRTNENLDGDVVKTGGGYNQWYHVAIERLKNNNGSYDTYVYIDGVNVYHHYDPTNNAATNYGNYPSQTTTIVLGAWWSADYALTGKISQWRYIRGNSGSDTIYNVRDGSFAVPTTPSQQETNTLLLIGVQGEAGDPIVSETEHPVYTLTASGDPTYTEDDPID